jgi:transposase
MIQITPQMRIWLAVEPVDFRKGIDGLAQVWCCFGQLA